MVVELDFLDLEEQVEDETESIATLEHSTICHKLAFKLGLFIEGKDLGRVFESSAEYRFLTEFVDQEPSKRNRRTAKMPDVSFVKKENLPTRLRSYPNIVPDLVVEVESPGDDPYQTEAKVRLYLEAGVSLVWLVRPYSRTVEVHRKNEKPRLLTEDEELEGDPVLSGLRIKLSDVFDFPADPNPEPDR
jgi:Uma2 family endonuclease